MQITLDEGYQFGLGVFETVAVERGEPLLLGWHLERLCGSLKELGIEQTVTEPEIREFLASRESGGERQALKVMVSEKNKVFTLRPNPYTEERRRKGFSLAYSTVYRNETSPLVRHKTMNYGDCILERRRGAAAGADEQIFLNSRGEICEGTATNIFFAREGRLYTPPVSCGLLPGVLRRFILEQFPVEERILKKADVFAMEECFVTNSLMGIMPVRLLGEKTFTPGEATRRCAEKYSDIL